MPKSRCAKVVVMKDIGQEVGFLPQGCTELPGSPLRMLSQCDSPRGSSVALNKGDVFIFSILLGQSPRSNFPVGSSSGSQKAIEIDEILAFQCFKEWGFHQFWSQGWRISAESQSWKTQGCTSVPACDNLF